MMNETSSIEPVLVLPDAMSGTHLVTAAMLAMVGAIFLFGAGFAHADLLHNAAHDSRHAFTFPCH